MKTPYEKLKSLPYASQYLKPGITVEQPNARATRMSDNDAAVALNHASKKETVPGYLCHNPETGMKETGKAERACINTTEAKHGSVTQIR